MSMRIRGAIFDMDGTLGDTVFVSVEAIVRTVDQLTLPGESREDAEARFTADKDGFVEIVFCIENSKAVAKQVKTGIQSDELIEILEGLEEGEDVVSGNYRAISRDLDNGAVVTINNENENSDES